MKQPFNPAPQGTQPHKALNTAMSVLAMVTLACGFGGLLPANSAANGPILEMVPAAAVDEHGQMTDPKFTFDPSDPQITVVVRIDPTSKVSNEPLTFTWYQETFDGDQELFSDKLQVSAGEGAFSIGKNPGTLSPGMYKVTAALGDGSRDVYFEVTQPQTAPASAGQAATGGPPAQGGSGTVPQATPPSATKFDPGSNGSTQAGCTLLLMYSDLSAVVYSSGPVKMSVVLLDCDAADVEVGAAMNGTPQHINTFHFAVQDPSSPHWEDFSLEPCGLSGGSDLPDDHLIVSANVLSGKAVGLSTQVDLLLGKDSLPPILHVISDHKRNSRVKKGDVITLTIDAKEPQPGGPWQTGMKDIQVVAMPGAQVNDTPFETAPRACAAKVKEVKPYKVSYTVPANPPLKFDLCVLALDLVNPEVSECGTYYTGDHWTGTILTTTTGKYSEGTVCSNEKWKSTMDLVVGGNGTVSGSGEAHLVATPKCSTSRVSPTDATTAHFNVTGTFDGKKFSLTINESAIDGSTAGLFNYGLLLGGQLEFSVTGKGSAGGLVDITRASADGVGTAIAHHIIDLKCIDCQ